MTAEELKFGSDGLGTEKCSQQSPGSKLIFSKANLTEFGYPHANVFMLLSETSLMTPLIVRLTGTLACSGWGGDALLAILQIVIFVWSFWFVVHLIPRISSFSWRGIVYQGSSLEKCWILSSREVVLMKCCLFLIWPPLLV